MCLGDTIAGLGGSGGGGITPGFRALSGPSGFASGICAALPAFGVLTGDPGALVTGASLTFGFGAPGIGPAAPGSNGGAPLAPGTGRALVFGSASGDRFVGNGLFGAAF